MSKPFERVWAKTSNIDWTKGWESISEQWMTACHFAVDELIRAHFRAEAWRFAAVLGWVTSFVLAMCLAEAA